MSLDPNLTAPALFRLIWEPEPELYDAAFRCEADAFRRHYAVDFDAHVAEFAPWAEASSMLVVADSDGTAVGVMRLIRPNPAGLKTLAEAGGKPWFLDVDASTEVIGLDPRSTWDVATLALPQGWGPHRAAIVAALYYGLVKVTEQNAVRSLVMNLDVRVRGLLGLMGLISENLPGAKPGPFCGSPASVPTYAHCDRLLDTQRRLNPEAYRLITMGVGLDGVSVPPASAFRLGTARPQPAYSGGLQLVAS